MGTSDRYAANASFNAFNAKSQLSVLGGANNVNRLGFTSSDPAGGTGGTGAPAAGAPSTRRNGGGARRCNTESWNGGINYAIPGARSCWSAAIILLPIPPR